MARESGQDFEDVQAKSVSVKILMRNHVITVFVKGYEFLALKLLEINISI